MLTAMSTIATVSFTACPDYRAASACLTDLFGPLGGLSRFVQPGSRVLIKPNLLSDRPPDSAVVTHPLLVQAIVRAVRDCGGRPAIGDSPASALKFASVLEKTGYRALCEDEGVPVVRFEESGSRFVSRNGFSIPMAAPVLDADVVINAPKAKTHVLTTLTAAVKNMYGVIPGYRKAMFHKQFPSSREFGRLLAAVTRAVPPTLNVLDAVTGMQGNGPSGGNPVHLGFLAASEDAFALDMALCRVLGVRTETVPYLAGLKAAFGGDDGATPPDGAADIRIRLAGTPASTLCPAGGFEVPGTARARLIPARLVKLLGPLIWIRPRMNERCIRCGQCVRACPASALALESAGPPRLYPERCIGCCCCHEVCPVKAVDMRQSPLLNLLRGGRML